MHFLRCGENAIHYRAHGLESGKPVIAFINSLGTDFRIWDAVIEALGDDYAATGFPTSAPPPIRLRIMPMI